MQLLCQLSAVVKTVHHTHTLPVAVLGVLVSWLLQMVTQPACVSFNLLNICMAVLAQVVMRGLLRRLRSSRAITRCNPQPQHGSS